HDCPVTALAYSPDGAHAASGSEDATVIIYDARTTVFAKAAFFKLHGHRGAVSALVFSPDSRLLASASLEDAELIIWDVDEGKAVREMHTAEAIHTLAYTPDGTMLFSGGINGSLTIWSTTTYQQTRTIAAHNSFIDVLVLSPDGRSMLTGGLASAQSLLWDLSTLQTQHKGPPHVRRSLPQQHATICAAFSPDGRRVATASDDRTSPIIIWDASTGAELVRLDRFPRGVLVMSLAFAPDGGRIVSGSMDSMVRIHDAGSGAHNMSLGKHYDSVYAVAFSPTGRLVASAGADCTVRLWDVTGKPGRLARTFRGHTGRVMGVLFSPDGGTVLSGSLDGTARLESTA
ncbi:WD40-repeat-containing domain protein, partial [Earliella scabrosa]